MSCPKSLIRLCWGCGSGDVGWCDISKRPYCNECGKWGRVNFGTSEDAVRQWHANLKKEGEYTEFELNEMLRIQNQDIDIEIDEQANINKLRDIFDREILALSDRMIKVTDFNELDNIAREVEKIGNDLRNITAALLIKRVDKVV